MEKNGVTCIQFAASFFQEKKKKKPIDLASDSAFSRIKTGDLSVS